MVKLINLVARMRACTVRRSFIGLLALLAFVLLQFGSTPLAQAQLTASDFDHASTGFVLNGQHQNVRCETCHLKGEFKGTPKDCVSCHGWNNPRAKFSVMPVTHIPTGNAPCESCHQSNMAQFVDATRTFNHAAVRSLTCVNCHSSNNPHPNVRTNPSDATHATVTACDKCHTTIVFSGPKIPTNHIPIATVACTACHTNADYAVMPSVTNIHANARAGVTCAQCHGDTTTFPMTPAIKVAPNGHIAMNGQACETCHIAPGSDVQLPVVNGAKFSKSSFSHAGISNGCASCHSPNGTSATFFGISNIIAMPSSSPFGPTSHIPTSAACEACHKPAPSGVMPANAIKTVPGTGFMGLLPNKVDIHANVTVSCATCHEMGMSWLGVDLYPRTQTYDPVSTAPYIGFQTRPYVGGGGYSLADALHPGVGDCSNCHSVSSGFGAPAKPGNHIPTTASCAACHKDPSYSVMPAITDIHANASTMVCATCHANTTTYPMTPVIVAPPVGHVAQGGLGCDSCHVGSNTSMKPGAVVNGANFANSAYVHTSATTGCASCHAGAPNIFGVAPKNIDNLSPVHMPVTGVSTCETCHSTSGLTTQIPLTGATAGTASFAGAQFTHTGITATCASCHGQNISSGSFAGNPNIVVMPQSSSTGPNSHMPTTAACQSCHTVIPSGLIAASATTGTGFKTSLPTPANIHGNTTTGCSACHESGTWVGVDLYTRTTTSPYAGGTYFGFQTRPTTSGGLNAIQDATPHPASGECSNCHVSYVGGFAAPGLPSGHIPTKQGVGCAACHKDPSYSVMPAIADIHVNAQAGMTCTQCHGNTTTYPMTPAITSLPVGHIDNPGNLDCQSCHVGPNSSLNLPVSNGANFGNSAYVHSSATTGCDSCHGAGAATANLYGVKPKNIATLTPGHLPLKSGAACEACHKNSPGISQVPMNGAIGGSPSFAGASFDHAYTAASCASCHGQGVLGASFAGNPNILVMPSSGAPGANSHIPTTAACEACHGSSYPAGTYLLSATKSVPGSGFQALKPTPAAIHGNSDASCSTCHETGTWLGVDLYTRTTNSPYVPGPAAISYYGFQVRPTTSGGGYAIADGSPHPVSGECSNCHVNFSTGFTGPVQPNGHIPTNTVACAACHKDPSYSAMPATADIHANVNITTCANCHASTNTYPMKPLITAPPAKHIAQGGLDCQACHVGPNSSLNLPVSNGANFGNSAYVHSSATTGCDSCHGAGAATANLYGVKPKNIASLSPGHMPVSNGAACENCHKVSPGISQVPMTGAVGGSPSFAGAGFDHVYTSAKCAVCHGQNVSGSNFAGNASIIAMPPSGIPGMGSHVPSTAACEACHLAAPAGLLPGITSKSVGTSDFRLAPLPTKTNLHNNVTVACSSCHETGMSWAGVDLYPRTATYTAGALTPYIGFQTRPTLGGGGYSLADGSHPGNGECSNCHSVAVGFGVPSKPPGHIPTAATCSACHKSADYSVMPGTADIHANAQANMTCAQCHSDATVYPMTPAIVVPPTGHIAMGTAGCDSCHVGTGSSMATLPVPDGAHFSGSLFNHSGINTSCANCHGSGVSPTGFYGISPVATANLSPSHMPASEACETCHINSKPTGLVPSAGMKTFAGAQFSHTGIITGCDTCHGPTIVPGSFAGKPNIVVMPATSPFGSAAHIPSSTTCESCHLGSTPSGLVAGSASKLTGPGTGFKSPAPTSSMIHANVTGSCANCHGDGQSWIGVGLYPSSPLGYVAHASYTGFQTRPGVGGSYAVNDPTHPGAGIDCSQCHSSFSSFGPPTMPSGHIPVATTAQCGNCHTGNFVDAPTVTNIHAYAQSTTANCVQCHSATSAAQFVLKNPIVTPDGDHIPMGSLSCESCHMGAQSSIKGAAVKTGDKFANSLFNHSGISTGCEACHGGNVNATTFIGLPSIKAIAFTGTQPHMRVGTNGCETCHTNSVPVGQVPAAGMKTFAGASFTHSGIQTDCAKCHGPSITPASFLGSPNIVVMPATTSGGHIPSSTVCESCHLSSTPSALIAGSATKTTGPGTGFKVGLPGSNTIHANSDTTSCNVCHESGKTWISVDTYTRGPSNSPSPGALFTGFQTRPIAGGGIYSVNDPSHVGFGVGDCSNCHVGYTGFGPPTVPTNHIPYVTGTSCGSCHTVADFSVMPTNANIHKYAQSATTNCAQCHSATNADTYNLLAGMASKPLVKPATNHIAMAALSCEACHVDSLTGLTTTTTSFAGGKYSHSGVISGCNTCHLSGTGPFQGTLSIVVMPPTTGTAASTQHLPTSTTCESCHLGSTPSTLLAAVATNTAATSTFATPVPTAAMNHAGVTASCNACHEAGGSSTSDVWMNMAAYPITTTAPFKGFQVRPSTTGQFRVADAAHPASGDCSACHSSFTDFSSAVLPQYHIPTASVACTNCHTTSNYSTMPSFTAIHANAPAGATTTNCVLCHSATNAANYMQLAGMAGKLKFPPTGHVAMGSLGCESCHVGANSSITAAALPVKNGATFTNSAYSHSGVTSGCANCHGDGVTALSFIGQTPKAIPAGHVPNSGSVDCVACHTTAPNGLIAYSGAVVGSANTFATTKYSHSGITDSCQTCHAGGTNYLGITNMVVLSNFPTHIPTTTKPDCASCHLSSTPSALVTWTLGAVPKVAPNTGFGLKSQAPTGAMIHAGVTSGCVSCHEAGMSWLEVDTSYYTRTPTVKTSGANYLGFNTRPYLNGTGYSINDGNHPTGTTDCSNCHGSTTSFSVTAVPTNHIPYLATATCANCHTNINLGTGQADFSPVPTWTNIHKYAPSTSTNCAQCHSEANALKYNAGGVVIKSPASIAKHVPYGTVACETCHVGLSPVIDTSKFAGGKYIHTGVSTGCATCHGNGLSATNFTGISNLVAIPTNAAMGATSHIPYTAACEACHAGSTPSALLSVTGTPAAVSGFRLPAPTGIMIHTGISSGCSACHDTNYVWKGMDLYPINPSAITTNGSYKGFQTRPIGAPVTTTLGKFGITDSAHPLAGDCSQCHTSTTAFSGIAKPAGHMPTATNPACSVCHSSTDYSVVGLATVSALHTGITYQTTVKPATAATMAAKLCSNCHTVGTGGTSGTAPFTGCTTSALANCASPPAMSTYQPATVGLHPVHVPIGASDCNACHVNVSSFAGVNMDNATMHISVNSIAGVQCMACHERGLAFYGVTKLKVRPNGHHTGQDCTGSKCHTYDGGFKALVKPVMRGALVAPDMGRIKPTTQAGKPIRGSLGNSFDHKGVAAGKCKDCHDGKSASGMPARHLMVATSCDSCHRPTTWLPAQFNHNGITPNTCLACHNGMGASSKPAGHFMTSRSCDSCHKNMSWTPVNYQHLSPLYRASPDKLTCISCHDTNGEIIRRQARALTRTKPIPVGP